MDLSHLKYFNIAQNCAKLMLYLVNDILDYSQYESHLLILNYDTF